MENERRMLYSDLEDQICAYFQASADCYAEQNLWVIPYIGRRACPAFYEHFMRDCNGKYRREFEWQGVEKYKELNCYDSETHEHYLEVLLFENGGNRGLIKSVVSHHRYTWETTSNWQDHHESHSGEVGAPTSEDIEGYCQILDDCTEDVTQEIVHNLVLNIATNEPTVSIGKDVRGEFVRMPGCEGAIYIDEICQALRFGRSFIDVFMLPDYRIKRGVSNSELERRGMAAVLGQISLADLYGGDMELRRHVDRFLSERLEKNRKRFERNAEEKMAWMAGEVMRVMSRVSKRRKYRMSYRHQFSSADVKFWFKERGQSRYWTESTAAPGTLCFFNRMNRCVGYVTEDFKICNGNLECIGTLDGAQGCRYEVNKYGWLLNDQGKYMGCVGVLGESENADMPSPFATSVRVELLRQYDRRLSAMNLFDFAGETA